MTQATLLNNLLSSYGRSATVAYSNSAERQEISAIIVPMRYKNKTYLDLEGTITGLKDDSCFLFIGPPSPDFSEHYDQTLITCDNRKYFITNAEKVYFKQHPFYMWAVLKPVIKGGCYENS